MGEVIHLLYINLHAFCISIISKSLCNSSTSFPSSHGVFLDHPALFQGFVITISSATRTASECVTGTVYNTNVTTKATVRAWATDKQPSLQQQTSTLCHKSWPLTPVSFIIVIQTTPPSWSPISFALKEMEDIAM